MRVTAIGERLGRDLRHITHEEDEGGSRRLHGSVGIEALDVALDGRLGSADASITGVYNVDEEASTFLPRHELIE